MARTKKQQKAQKATPTLNGHNIERMSWKTLARLYYAAQPGSAVRKAINAEARRCGYTPRVILACHAE